MRTQIVVSRYTGKLALAVSELVVYLCARRTLKEMFDGDLRNLGG